MNKYIGWGILGVAIVAAIIVFTARDNKNKSAPVAESNQASDQGNFADQKSFNFNNPKKSAHYESNTPAHGAILAAASINVVLDFNFDLTAPSAIYITQDGKEYGTGNKIIDANKLSMRRNFDQSAPDGLYKVSYNACWPDKSCHDGYFEFAIDRGLAANYQRLTNQNEVTVRMSQIKFQPKDIVISKGTKVTWINDDEVEHYVNTDSHPAHSYYPEQNSRALKNGENYSLVFTQAGIYPYHCSAHADVMQGNIIVE
ncbi:MAG: cupredoxin domain-containing protein [Candidatus Doudnabacteria bacterium]|nr:cupredoxin domain-containing protein [Candidatus Doudnabacteria bacterium]